MIVLDNLRLRAGFLISALLLVRSLSKTRLLAS